MRGRSLFHQAMYAARDCIQQCRGVSFIVVLCAFMGVMHGAQARPADNGDGTYTNPSLYADYPDPDIIRVGEDFYFASTTFANSPGLTLLHSKDLVNWEFASHIVPRLNGMEQYDLKNGNAYRGGLFAASLRHHNGVFYAVVTPVKQNTRIYYSKDIKGPWAYHELDRAAFDPAMFIEPDGKAYIATSGGWDGTVTLLSLSNDYSKVMDVRKIHYYKGAEGSKLVKRGEYYYLFNALPASLKLIVSRAKSLYGPWESHAQIDDRSGGHQGGIVDLPDGNWYGFVMVDAGAIGRMTNISPVFWEDDWPVWGTKEAPGKVPASAIKPVQGKPVMQLATSDDFNAPVLGLQWQWNHNPDDARWSLRERRGYLRLESVQANEFWTARNTLTQKGQGPWSRGEVEIDASNLQAGDMCGFGTLGKFNGHIVIQRDAADKLFLSMQVIEDTAIGRQTEVRVPSLHVAVNKIHLRTDMDFRKSRAEVAYSLDGKDWHVMGGSFALAYDWRTGTFQGQQFALFCYSPHSGRGYIDVDAFRFTNQP
ncbi:MAG: glycoside hydrolase 43 family protein [Pseudomonadota bacterium]